MGDLGDESRQLTIKKIEYEITMARAAQLFDEIRIFEIHRNRKSLLERIIEQKKELENFEKTKPNSDNLLENKKYEQNRLGFVANIQASEIRIMELEEEEIKRTESIEKAKKLIESQTKHVQMQLAAIAKEDKK